MWAWGDDHVMMDYEKIESIRQILKQCDYVYLYNIVTHDQIIT